MFIDEPEFLGARIFNPFYAERLREIAQPGRRFVHYTSAEVALSIIDHEEVWLRNASTMNDYSEIAYGAALLSQSYKGVAGEQFRAVLDSFIKGEKRAELERLFDDWQPLLRADTYMTCISEHLPEENDLGRLSMWRAYGGSAGVALVLNTAPFQQVTDVLATYSSPVAYLTLQSFEAHLSRVTQNMVAYEAELRVLGANAIFGHVFNAFKHAILCTKHPGFAEEREWRVFYVPSLASSKHIGRSFKTVRGTPQIVHTLPLKNLPDEGFSGAELSQIIDRVIIGPCEHPQVIRRAIGELLGDRGVPDPYKRIAVSQIPLRHYF